MVQSPSLASFLNLTLHAGKCGFIFFYLDYLIRTFVSFYLFIYLLFKGQMWQGNILSKTYLLTLLGDVKRKSKLRDTLRQGEIVALREGESRWDDMWAK